MSKNPTHARRKERRSRQHQAVLDRGLQVSIVARLTHILAFTMTVCLGLALAAPLAYGWLGGQLEWGWSEARWRAGLMASLFALPLLCGLIGFFALAVREMFHVAGPCYRFSQVFRGLASLSVRPGITLRRRDYLKPLAGELDAGLLRLHEELSTLRQLTDESLARLAELEVRVDPLVTAPTRRSLEGLRDRLQRFDLGEEGPVVATAPEELTPVS